jgi:hypothetical protein
MKREHCQDCCFWDRYESDGGAHALNKDLGDCRRNPPPISEQILVRVMPGFGIPQTDDLELNVYAASAFPVTHQESWCGRFKPLPITRSDLFAKIDAAEARVTQSFVVGGRDDRDVNDRNHELYAIIEQVQALPNTRENLAIRARAVCSAADCTGVAAEMSLSELGAHAESNAGELVRDILACLLDQVPG